MKAIKGVGLSDVKAIYDGPVGDLWELVMGQQIHIGGFASSMELAKAANVGPGQFGIDLCCCSGAGMRFLTRFANVDKMHGVDATENVINRGINRNHEERLSERINFSVADACETGLDSEQADFVWGEDAWCYVENKPALISEAARLTKPGGTIAFTDWVLGDEEMTDDEAQRFLNFMKFPNIESIKGYKKLLIDNGCKIIEARPTGRYAECIDLYIDMLNKQLTYDALKIINFDMTMMTQLGEEMAFIQNLAHANKITQGLFVARKK